jgi:hypothetical protein
MTRAGLAGILVSLACAASAHADPVTVNLRIEGPTGTIFEGPVTTDVRPFHFTSGQDTSDHECDGTSADGGPHATPVPTRGAVVAAAPLSTTGSWFDGFGASFDTIDGQNVAYDSASGRYLVEYENWKAADLGACADDAVTGDQDLFAYGTGSEPLLKLDGPATAQPGQPVTVKVTDGRDGSAIAGAAVGGTTTGADGTATVAFSDRGPHDLKATRDGAIRSNRLEICVTDGADGSCGTTPAAAPSPAATPPAAPARDRTPPQGRVSGIAEQERFSRAQAPRELAGTVSADPSGLYAVKLRLTRRWHQRCSYFSGRQERFRTTRCGHGSPFGIGRSAEWTYLLPARLGPGRYVLDVIAIDGAFNRDPLARGRNRIVFTVS